MTDSTPTPASYLVVVIMAGVKKVVGHAVTFAQALDRATSHAVEHFGATEFTRHITDSALFAIAPDGKTIEYQITPHDRPVPEDELSADEVDGLTEATAPEGILVDPIPTVYQNLETLGPDADWGDGDNFLLAEVTRGVFTAQVWRHDCIEESQPHSEIEITIDSTGMQGGEMFHDLCVFPARSTTTTRSRRRSSRRTSTSSGR
ncbi:hypothetical protein [Rhodococcus artemisiae]|uniref:Uncharacterized protein n=1 Tax=Rhodococcus artemisiae TaxID=714159 RepID=A0ABU7L9M8_9NOCA|nr:hypothetical protein [Rhodococcus artemisiae]MEE2058263.1 hypothetical protein [Rhodococcus artemisiae]